jgi:hypothetical protein
MNQVQATGHHERDVHAMPPQHRRENRSPIELFLAGVAEWDDQVVRLVQAA